MESGEKSRRRLCRIVGVVAVLLLVVILALVLGLTLGQKAPTFKATFIAKCKAFNASMVHEDDCEKLWGVFEQAYVGLDPCEVPMEAYDPLIAAVPFKLECKRMMFWSKTKDVVHEFTKKGDCFLTLENTLLGSVLDGLTWCGKKGSSETFTTSCPGWDDCVNNPVRSFWNRVSAAFADAACGDVSAMLNGSIATPFNPTSVFASIEVKRFKYPRVKSLNVVLVTQANSVTSCTDASLKDLQKELDQGITYNCKVVSEARLEECSSNKTIPCGACW
ncbi:ADP-ribosyl cyclase/cyclic ADP-ribose hydrolase 1-like [Anoplopoma fimbria]|uniref:ADP-ribosyl cyclase/cyclic ADP-ribose hydrolase 1-like n=1 Tax=Anoplopoma fimbria TaxID=229290 RepID=UPI0023EBA1F0|nr:ADP-ribosyl cyclase/cyclic ADP-ribose hydrolase 1-like [Anoplopoma fimbria]